jgi:hypothetical protein
MARGAALRLLCGRAAGAVLGASWLLGRGLIGPAASFGLVPLVARQRGSSGRFIAAIGYYACGSIPIVATIGGYWGADHRALGIGAWLGASLLLAAPWAAASTSGRALGALVATALPPLGVIGWLSPLNATGALFPGTGWIGLALLCVGVLALYGTDRIRTALLVSLGLVVVVSNLIYREPMALQGWSGVDTSIRPARGDIFGAIRNNQEVIGAGIAHGSGARVMVFPEAILDDWRPGTREQFSLAVPAGQVWILGADTASSDALVTATRGESPSRPLTRAAGLILGGNWLPGSRQTLRPAWWEPVFLVEHRRVWAALCVEQLQPWTWLEAMLQRPDVVLALSNGWWAEPPVPPWLPAGSAALDIEQASSRAWSRLMHSPVVWAVNR